MTAGSRLEWAGFVRSYICEPFLEALELEVPPPPELTKWVDTRYRPRLAYVPLLPIVAEIFGTDLIVERHLLVHRSSPVIDVVLACEGPDLPPQLYEESWQFITGDILFKVDDQMCRLEDLWDDAARVLLNENVDRPDGKTAFGCVGLFSRPRHQSELTESVDDEDVVSDAGIVESHSVILERNRLQVVIPEMPTAERSARESAWGYTLLATVCVHSRHFASHILDSIHKVAANGPGTNRRPEDVLDDAAAVQRTALLTRPLSHATNYLGHPALVGLFDESASRAALGQRDREHLDAALDGLDKFVNGVAAAAATRSQRKLNAVGFVLALMGVLIGATDVVAIARGRAGDNLWIFSTWALVLIATGLALLRTRPVRQHRQT